MADHETQDKESFCFAALAPDKCTVTKDGDPVLAYHCHLVDSEGQTADEIIETKILITDSEGTRRAKVAEAISLKFRDRFNISLSTVIFG